MCCCFPCAGSRVLARAATLTQCSAHSVALLLCVMAVVLVNSATVWGLYTFMPTSRVGDVGTLGTWPTSPAVWGEIAAWYTVLLVVVMMVDSLTVLAVGLYSPAFSPTVMFPPLSFLKAVWHIALLDTIPRTLAVYPVPWLAVGLGCAGEVFVMWATMRYVWAAELRQHAHDVVLGRLYQFVRDARRWGRRWGYGVAARRRRQLARGQAVPTAAPGDQADQGGTLPPEEPAQEDLPEEVRRAAGPAACHCVCSFCVPNCCTSVYVDFSRQYLYEPLAEPDTEPPQGCCSVSCAACMHSTCCRPSWLPIGLEQLLTERKGGVGTDDHPLSPPAESTQQDAGSKETGKSPAPPTPSASAKAGPAAETPRSAALRLAGELATPQEGADSALQLSMGKLRAVSMGVRSGTPGSAPLSSTGLPSTSSLPGSGSASLAPSPATASDAADSASGFSKHMRTGGVADSKLQHALHAMGVSLSLPQAVADDLSGLGTAVLRRRRIQVLLLLMTWILIYVACCFVFLELFKAYESSGLAQMALGMVYSGFAFSIKAFTYRIFRFAQDGSNLLPESLLRPMEWVRWALACICPRPNGMGVTTNASDMAVKGGGGAGLRLGTPAAHAADLTSPVQEVPTRQASSSISSGGQWGGGDSARRGGAGLPVATMVQLQAGADSARSAARRASRSDSQDASAGHRASAWAAILQGDEEGGEDASPRLGVDPQPTEDVSMGLPGVGVGGGFSTGSLEGSAVPSGPPPLATVYSVKDAEEVGAYVQEDDIMALGKLVAVGDTIMFNPRPTPVANVMHDVLRKHAAVTVARQHRAWEEGALDKEAGAVAVTGYTQRPDDVYYTGWGRCWWFQGGCCCCDALCAWAYGFRSTPPDLEDDVIVVDPFVSAHMERFMEAFNTFAGEAFLAFANPSLASNAVFGMLLVVEVARILWARGLWVFLPRIVFGFKQPQQESAASPAPSPAVAPGSPSLPQRVLDDTKAGSGSPGLAPGGSDLPSKPPRPVASKAVGPAPAPVLLTSAQSAADGGGGGGSDWITGSQRGILSVGELPPANTSEGGGMLGGGSAGPLARHTASPAGQRYLTPDGRPLRARCCGCLCPAACTPCLLSWVCACCCYPCLQPSATLQSLAGVPSVAETRTLDARLRYLLVQWQTAEGLYRHEERLVRLRREEGAAAGAKLQAAHDAFRRRFEPPAPWGLVTRQPLLRLTTHRQMWLLGAVQSLQSHLAAQLMASVFFLVVFTMMTHSSEGSQFPYSDLKPGVYERSMVYSGITCAMLLLLHSGVSQVVLWRFKIRMDTLGLVMVSRPGVLLVVCVILQSVFTLMYIMTRG